MEKRPKVFFIGKNKTATTSLHVFFQRAGYKSYHCLAKSTEGGGEGGHLGKRMSYNIEKDRSILNGIDGADVYSDLLYAKREAWFDGAEHFKKLWNKYPDAYFVLNTRNTDDWVKSRTRHKKGEFIKRVMRAQGVKTKLEVQEIWRKEKEDHERRVLEWFPRVPNVKFRVFDIDKDNIKDLMEWLKDDYPNLMEKNYGHKNATSN